MAPIHEAASQGDLGQVANLTKWCCFNLPKVVRAKEGNTGSTPLILAASAGYSVVCKLLLERGADVNDLNHENETALFHASVKGHKEVMELLLDAHADVETKTKKGWTAFLGALGKGETDAVLLLFRKHASEYTKLPAEEGGATALILAAERGFVDIVSLLVENGVPANKDQDADGKTALIAAAKAGHLKVVRILVAKGADVEAKDLLHNTALLYAAERSLTHRDIMNELLTHHAEINIKQRDTGKTPLILCACNGDTEAVELLLARGADHGLKDDEQYTALMRAAAQGHQEVVELLLNHGADVIEVSRRIKRGTSRSDSLGGSTSSDALAAKGDSGGSVGSSATDSMIGSSALEVASTEPIRDLIKAALNCGPPVIPKQPEIRKEKLDLKSPSILVYFAPPLPTNACQRIINLRYHAHCLCDGEVVPITPEGISSPYIFRGLTRGKSYTFEIVAEASTGTGVPARTPPIFLATRPTTAPVMDKVSCSTGTLCVTFSSPEDNGGSEVTKYLLKVEPGNLQVEATTSPAMISGLATDEAYTVTIAATNVVGMGPWSQPSAEVRAKTRKGGKKSK